MKNTTAYLGHRRAVVGAAGVVRVDHLAARTRCAISPLVMSTVVPAAAPKTADAFGVAAAPAQRTAPGVRPRGAPV